MQSSVCTLSNTVLMRFRANSVLSSNAIDSAERLPLSRHVLPSLIIAQSLDFCIQLVLSISFELLERSKRTRLVLERQHYPETRKIVNEGNPVLLKYMLYHLSFTIFRLFSLFTLAPYSYFAFTPFYYVLYSTFYCCFTLTTCTSCYFVLYAFLLRFLLVSHAIETRAPPS